MSIQRSAEYSVITDYQRPINGVFNFYDLGFGSFPCDHENDFGLRASENRLNFTQPACLYQLTLQLRIGLTHDINMHHLFTDSD